MSRHHCRFMPWVAQGAFFQRENILFDIDENMLPDRNHRCMLKYVPVKSLFLFKRFVFVVSTTKYDVMYKISVMPGSSGAKSPENKKEEKYKLTGNMCGHMTISNQVRRVNR